MRLVIDCVRPPNGGRVNQRCYGSKPHRLVRKSTRPRARLERYVRQCVSVPRIADLAEMICQQSAAWIAAPPRRSDCVSLLSRCYRLVLRDTSGTYSIVQDTISACKNRPPVPTNHTFVWFLSHIGQRIIPLSLTYEMASVAERHARAPAERQAPENALCLRY